MSPKFMRPPNMLWSALREYSEKIGSPSPGLDDVSARRLFSETSFDHHVVKPVKLKILDELLAGLSKSNP